MSTTMLDTYSMIKKLQAAGVPEKQAEAQVALVFEVAEKTFATKADTTKLGEDVNKLGTTVTKLGEDLKSCATKEDLKACATKEDLKIYATKEDLKSCALDTRKDMAALENRLIIKLGGLMTGLMIMGFAFLSYAHH